MRNVMGWRRLRALLACMVLVLSAFPMQVFADKGTANENRMSLSIQYPCEGTEFMIYRVADVSEDGTCSLTGEFQNYAVSPEDTETFRTQAPVLAAYAQRDQIAPADAGLIGSDGSLTFELRGSGMYLVDGARRVSGGFVYTPEPFFVILPGRGEDGSLMPDVAVMPKYGRDPDLPEGQTTKRKVLKIWKDEDTLSRRSESVTVQLLMNGAVWDTAVLSAENNWRYQWDELDASHSWRLVEETVPSGYTVTVAQEGNAFVVTNTCQVPGNPDNPGPGKDSGGGGGSDGGGSTPEQPSYTDIPDGRVPDSPAPELLEILENLVPLASKLPQTGQLWWPVPLLSAGGLLLISLGCLRRREVGNEK